MAGRPRSLSFQERFAGKISVVGRDGFTSGVRPGPISAPDPIDEAPPIIPSHPTRPSNVIKAPVRPPPVVGGSVAAPTQPLPLRRPSGTRIRPAQPSGPSKADGAIKTNDSLFSAVFGKDAVPFGSEPAVLRLSGSIEDKDGAPNERRPRVKFSEPGEEPRGHRPEQGDTQYAPKIAPQSYGRQMAGPPQSYGQSDGQYAPKIAPQSYGRQMAGPPQSYGQSDGQYAPKIAPQSYGRQMAGPPQSYGQSDGQYAPKIAPQSYGRQMAGPPQSYGQSDGQYAPKIAPQSYGQSDDGQYAPKMEQYSARQMAADPYDDSSPGDSSIWSSRHPPLRRGISWGGLDSVGLYDQWQGSQESGAVADLVRRRHDETMQARRALRRGVSADQRRFDNRGSPMGRPAGTAMSEGGDPLLSRRPRPITYRPRTERIQEVPPLGHLGPSHNYQTDEYKAKAESRRRRMEYAREVQRLHLSTAASGEGLPAPPPRVSLHPRENDLPSPHARRERALSYAAAIPRPRVRRAPKSSERTRAVTDSAWSPMEYGDEQLSRLESMENQHRDDQARVEALRRAFAF